GFVGGDAGRYIENRLWDEGVPSEFVHIQEPTRTNINVQNAVGDPPTLLHERGPTVTPEEIDEFQRKFCRQLPRSHFLVIGGTQPPGTPEDYYTTLLNEARDHGVRCILDIDAPNMQRGLAARPYMIKPNHQETERILGRTLTVEELPNAAKEIRDRYSIDLVVVSMGKHGAIGVTGEEVIHACTPDIQPVSTIGCGDSMVAGIVHILNRYGALEEAMRYGSAAGAATALTNGAEIGKRKDIMSLLDRVKTERWE
ncbi:MAG: hexose kinase, partial [Armatimonadetes bacterium]|nr:hexose kinase [Armatimonadota bacterium]